MFEQLKKYNSRNAIARIDREFGPTKKKKNTYTVRLDGLLLQLELFAFCSATPIPVVYKNGEQVNATAGFVRATPFPNPHAANMVQAYNMTGGSFGKLGKTVVEYLDKETGKPVCMLFPYWTEPAIMPGYDAETFLSHLNHATRRDLAHQINIRNAKIREHNIRTGR